MDSRVHVRSISVANAVWWVSIITWLSYVIVALGVTNLYPFSTFPMYSDSVHANPMRMLGRTADGEVFEVKSYTNWQCEDLDALRPEDIHCEGSTLTPVGYLVKQNLDLMRQHAGGGDTPVWVIVRAWDLPADGPPSAPVDCDVRACFATERP